MFQKSLAFIENVTSQKTLDKKTYRLTKRVSGSLRSLHKRLLFLDSGGLPRVTRTPALVTRPLYQSNNCPDQCEMFEDVVQEEPCTKKYRHSRVFFKDLWQTVYSILDSLTNISKYGVVHFIDLTGMDQRTQNCVVGVYNNTYDLAQRLRSIIVEDVDSGQSRYNTLSGEELPPDFRE